MKWVLNRKKGTTINHPAVGKIEGGIAYEVTDQEANQLKGIYNIIIFDGIKPKKE